MREMKLQELKTKTPAELVSFAEELEVENASTMRKQELMFGILKQLSARETDIVGEGVVEVLPRRLRLSALVGSELPAGNVARRVGRSHHGDALGAAN